MSVTEGAASGRTSPADERMAATSPLRRLLGRPELGAVAGAIAIWTFFAIVAGGSGFLSLRGTASYLEVAAELGILAVAVSLLMIGGEFDLSIGSIIGGCGIMLMLLTVEFGQNIWLAMGAALLFAVLVGLLNGYLVLLTGLPSFIVTLGTLFIIRGLAIATTRSITGRTQLGGLDDVSGYPLAETLFASNIAIRGVNFPISIVWWVGLVALATFVLLRTSFGNWIFGVGGNLQAARNVGVPIRRVKLTLFTATAVSAWLVAMIQAVSFNSADVLRGAEREFEAIIAVVIGGTLLTGGYGSAIGSFFGALIFGMANQGIFFAGVSSDWFQVFLGVMLLIAVLINRWVRKRATEAR